LSKSQVVELKFFGAAAAELAAAIGSIHADSDATYGTVP
jgi:hypothetical protein